MLTGTEGLAVPPAFPPALTRSSCHFVGWRNLSGKPGWSGVLSMVFNTNKCPGLSPAPLTYLGGGCGSRPTSGVARLLSLVLRRVRQEDPGFRTTLTGLREPTLKDRNLETRKWGSHLLLPNGKSINQLMLGFIPLSWPLRVSCAASTHQGTSDFLNNYYYEGMALLCRVFTCAVQNMPRL